MLRQISFLLPVRARTNPRAGQWRNEEAFHNSPSATFGLRSNLANFFEEHVIIRRPAILCVFCLAIALLVAVEARSGEIITVILDADFDNSTLDPLPDTDGTPATQTLLQEGTAVGIWTVTNQGNAELLRNTAIAGDQVFKPDQGGPDFTLSAIPSPLASTTIEFDLAIRRYNAATADRNPLISAYDESNNELFTLSVNATSGSDQRKLGYISGGTPTWLGNVDDISRFVFDADAAFPAMQRVTLDLDTTSFSILLDGTTLASGIAYETLGVENFASLQFTSNAPGNAGYYLDNIFATFSIPEPSTAMLLTGLLGIAAVRRRRGLRRRSAVGGRSTHLGCSG